MFIISRVIIGFIFFACMIILIKKLKFEHKLKGYVFSVILSVILITVIAFLPFENFFITFDSPQSVYNYMNFGKSNVKLVINGKNSDFVINDKINSYSYLIVPKYKDGWKIGLGADTKMIMQKIYDDIIINVFQYKNTNDYFIVLLNTNGGPINLKDSNNSKFYSLEKTNNQLNKVFITYFLNISNFDSKYWLSINDKKICLLND